MIPTNQPEEATMNHLTEHIIDPHSPFWATLVDTFDPQHEHVTIERPARREIRERSVRYGKHVVTKSYVIYTNRPNTNA
jgi:hypothetical protein